MKCQRCGAEDTKVLESRIANDSRSIRRRRVCRHCERRFTTYEREEAFVFHIRKKDGQIQPYQREKTFRSIQVACQKRRVKIEEIDFMLAKIEAKVSEMGEPVVTSRQLGNLIIEILSDFDPVAYVRFASVYKVFNDPKEFYSLLRPMNRGSSNSEPEDSSKTQ